MIGKVLVGSGIVASCMTNFMIIKILLAICGVMLIVVLMLKAFLKHLRRRDEDSLHADTWFGKSQPYLLLFFLVIFLVCVITSTVFFSEKFLPDTRSWPATETVNLFNATTIITGIAFFLTQILLFYFAFRFRAGTGTRARHITGVLKLELVWTIVPAITFIILFAWGQMLWTKIIDMPDEAIEIEVMAEQFNWRIRYPGKDRAFGRTDFRFISTRNPLGIDLDDLNSHDDFIPVQMHVPKNRSVKLILRSKDVIHSFYIPHFRTKMDALPGMVTEMQFTAGMTTHEMREKLGDPTFDYEVACAELCGRMHFAMKLVLVVDEEDDFERWYNAQLSWISDKVSYANR